MSEEKVSRAVRQRQNEAERKGLMDVLEHVLAVGNQCRHERLRAQEWERQTLQSKKKPTSGRKLKSALIPPVPLLHPQSIRLYGRDGRFEPEPWPKRPKVSEDNRIADDAAWNDEIGDDIHPIIFAKHRLSESFGWNCGSVNDAELPMLPPESSTIQQEDVPRALLLRCWERAVHAASRTIELDIAALVRAGNADETAQSAATASLAEATGNLQRDLAESAETSNLSHDMAKEKCKRLGISSCVAPSSDQVTCQSCQLRFESRDQLDHHFYGSVDDKIKGCCWRLISETQQKLLDQVLQAEVKNQGSNLLHFLLVTSAAHLNIKKQLKKSSKIPTADDKDLYRWEDVLECLESHLIVAKMSTQTAPHANASTITKNAGSIYETLETVRDGSRLPFVLNSQILECAISRIISRYGKLPR